MFLRMFTLPWYPVTFLQLSAGVSQLTASSMGYSNRINRKEGTGQHRKALKDLLVLVIQRGGGCLSGVTTVQGGKKTGQQKSWDKMVTQLPMRRSWK